MTTTTLTTKEQFANLKALLGSTAIKNKLTDIWANQRLANSFVSSIISIANSNTLLQQAEPMSVLGAAMVAATLQLQVNPAVGQAYIIPYNERGNDGKYHTRAQFQLGYKGLLQLCLRSGQMKKCITAIVHEGELVSGDEFMEDYVFSSANRTSDKIIGYMAHIELLNGFTKTAYWTMERVQEHARKYSQAYAKGWSSPWKSNFNEMAQKTVLKLMLKFAPISIELAQATKYDQAVIEPNTDTDIESWDIDNFTADYVDNKPSNNSISQKTGDKLLEAAIASSKQNANKDLQD